MKLKNEDFNLKNVILTPPPEVKQIIQLCLLRINDFGYPCSPFLSCGWCPHTRLFSASHCLLFQSALLSERWHQLSPHFACKDTTRGRHAKHCFFRKPEASSIRVSLPLLAFLVRPEEVLNFGNGSCSNS